MFALCGYDHTPCNMSDFAVIHILHNAKWKNILCDILHAVHLTLLSFTFCRTQTEKRKYGHAPCSIFNIECTGMFISSQGYSWWCI